MKKKIIINAKDLRVQFTDERRKELAEAAKAEVTLSRVVLSKTLGVSDLAKHATKFGETNTVVNETSDFFVSHGYAINIEEIANTLDADTKAALLNAAKGLAICMFEAGRARPIETRAAKSYAMKLAALEKQEERQKAVLLWESLAQAAAIDIRGKDPAIYTTTMIDQILEKVPTASGHKLRTLIPEWENSGIVPSRAKRKSVR